MKISSSVDRRRWLSVCVLAVALFQFTGSRVTADTEPSELLMTLNEIPVTQGDLETMIRINFGPKFSTLTADQRETVRINRTTETQSQLIDRTLLVSAARASGLKVTAAEVNAQVSLVKKELPAGLSLVQYLKGMGVSAADFREHAENQAIINKLSKVRIANIPKPSAQDIRNYYQQNPDFFLRKDRAEVSHILVSTSGSVTEKQLATSFSEAEGIRRRLLKEGVSKFGQVAREVSHCPSKEEGGSLGIVEKGAMVAAFDTAVFSQKPGTIGRVVRSPKGYHVIKADKRYPAERISLTEAAPDIEAMLLYKSREQTMEGYLRTLRLSAKVVKPEPKKPVAKPKTTAPTQRK